MSVFDEINDLSAEAVLSRIDLPLAKDGKSYVCPLCNNGTGDTGDGIKPRNSKGRVRWKCHRCDKDFSNFDLAAATLGIVPEREPSYAAREVGKLFGIYDEPEPNNPNNRGFSFSRKRDSARQSQIRKERASEMDEKKSASEPRDYANMYKYCRGNVAAFLDGRGGSFRGLTLATFRKYGLGVNPEFGVEGQEKCPHLIIPYDNYHYLARAIEGHDRSQHGVKAGLYEPVPISSELPNFIFEGELDALSVAQVIGDWKYGIVATGGTSGCRKAITELEKRFGNAECKPSFILMFDNDTAGKTASETLSDMLQAAGYPCVRRFFEHDTAGKRYRSDDGTERTVAKVDANSLLQEVGESGLIDRMLDVIEKSDGELERQAAAMLAAAEQEQQAAMDACGMKLFSCAEYFAKEFFHDMSLGKRYSERMTGFENLDALQLFLPGLYVLGALPSTGKSTWCWQLLDQLAERGETCIYCSFEMSRAELFRKSLVRELYKRYPELSERLNLSSANIRRGACSDLEELNEIAAKLAKTATNLKVAQPTNTSAAELIEQLKPFVSNADKPSVIAIDYLQIIPSKGKAVSAKEKIDDAMLRLKDFQRETDSTMIIISSFNRDSYYQSASFASFKESGAIEYSADVIWGLEVNGVDASGEPSQGESKRLSKEKVRPIKLSCLKNRNGGLFDCFFEYHAAHDYFKPIVEEVKRSPHIR